MSRDGLVKNKLQAVIWDYDGTLVDSRQKRFNVNQTMIAALTGRAADDFPALRSLAAYEAADSRAANWREFYMKELRLTEAQTNEAGRRWAEFLEQDDTPVAPIKGIPEALEALNGLTHGIVSQNGRAEIQNSLSHWGLDHYFGCVIGYEEVGSDRQKPAPDGLLACLEALSALEPGVVCYVGDYETDAQMAVQTNAAFKKQDLGIEVIMIGAFYGYPGAGDGWSIQPDYAAYSANDIVSIVTQISV